MTNMRFSTWAFILLFITSLLLVAHLLFDFVTPVIMSLAIVSLFSPIHKKIKKCWPKRPHLAASLSTVLVLLCVIIPLTLFFVALTQQLLGLIKSAQNFSKSQDLAQWAVSLQWSLDWLKDFLAKLGIYLSVEKVINYAANLGQVIVSQIYATLGFIASNLITIIFNFILTLALVFVFFASGTGAKKFFMNLVPLPTAEKERLISRFEELASAVFIGNGMISIIEGTLGGILFFIFGISGALIWGVLMTIFAFLPLIGASIVIIPTTVFLLFTTSTVKATLFLILNIIHITILETFLKPRLIGGKSQMHAILVFLSIISGIRVYGIFGLFYGPLLVTLFLTLAAMYREHYRDKLLKD